MFNTLADIISNEEEKLKRIKKTSLSRKINALKKDITKDNKTENTKVDKVMTQNLDKVNQDTKCWLCKNENRLINCEQLLNKRFIEKKESVNKGRLCFNYLPKGHVLKECKTNFFCRIEG